MKLTLIGPVYPYRGGIAHYTTSLAEALKKHGHELQIVSFIRQYPAFLYPGKSDKDPSANSNHIQAQYVLDPIYPWTWLQAASSIRKFEPALVIFMWWTTFWGPAYAGLAYLLVDVAKKVFLIHNVIPHESKPWDRWLARLALRSGNVFIVQSPHELEKLKEFVTEVNISYCKHPVYQRFSDQIVSKEDARKSLNLPARRTKPVLLFFGIIRPYKGLKVLLDAISKAGIQSQLIVAGEFWEDVETYNKQIIDLGLTEQVTLINRYIPDEEAHLLFSASDGFLAPYLEGTQSGAVERAFGYGLPVIVSEKIAAGITDANISKIHVVPSGDVPQLVQALQKFDRVVTEHRVPEPAQDDWNRMVETIENLQGSVYDK